MFKKNNRQKGVSLILVIVFVTILTIFGVTILQWSSMQAKSANQAQDKELAFQIAEAGIEYYRWHLAHASEDYQDGTGNSGPYIHDYKDINGNILGQFSLEIDPPPSGSTVVTIKSTGYLNSNPNLKRKIVSRVGIPSYAEYSFLINSNAWFGNTEHVKGKLHSNGGIRLDGTCDSIISSAKETYICTPTHGCSNETKPGIWGQGGPQTFWRFPFPAIDFNIITTDLAKIRTDAQDQGVYLASSGFYGYYLYFKSNGTFDVYEVTGLTSPYWYKSTYGNWFFGSIDINTKTFLQNYSIPSNGLIFVEDTVWVEGIVEGRVTLGSGRFPENAATYTSAIINGNLVYNNKDGSDTIGIIAQKDIAIPKFSPDILEINGVLLAQYGATQRYYFYPAYSSVKNQITTYGSVISNKIWTWSWVSGSNTISGYKNTYTTYDSNLIYAPPPYFPKKEEFEVLSWNEMK
ncbi:MAG: pilus assembly PilX N-terminal domain-containing protein [Candidatus Kuenenbacteria bacterium]